MEPTGERPLLLTRAEVVVGNAIPVVGVIILGWSATRVVLLYVLDVWFCMLGLGASIMIQHRAELVEMVPKRYSKVRRVFFWIAVVTLAETILSAFAVVSGIGVIFHMGRSPADVWAEVGGDSGLLVPILVLVGSHGVRVFRGIREPGEGVWALPPQHQMMLFIGRMFLMVFLAWLASPGFLSRVLVPVYVTAVAALLTYSDLYPRRFLSWLAPGRKAALPQDGDGADKADTF